MNSENSNLSPLFQRAIKLIKAIPRGKVLSYSETANLISAPGCARHISYILSSSSKKYKLPWHRVLNSKGKISFSVETHYFEQKKLLEREKIKFIGEKVNLDEYLWRPSASEVKKLLKDLPTHIPLLAH